MSFVGSNILAGASGQGGGGGFAIERSLRFNSGDSSFLNRTPSAAGNSRTWTLSFWVKRTGFSAANCLFMSYNGSSISEDNYATIEFSSNESLRVGYAYASYKTTTRVFRDPSAWYHIVVVIDTTNSTSGDRVQIYVNGSKETSFSATHDPDLNQELAWNKASFIHRLGSEYNQQYSNNYLADIHFIDGQALAPTDFGELDNNNVWQPKKFEGNYTFSSTSTNLTPSSTAYPNTTLSNNNLTWTGSTANDTGTVSTLIPTNKKTYVEVTHTSTGGGNPGPGVANAPLSELGLDTVKAWWRGGTDGNISVSTLGSFSGSSTSWSNGDVLGIALDNTANSSAGSITFYKNGTQVWTGGSGWTSHSDLRFEWQNNGSGTSSGTWNFGATSFSYPLSGYTGLFSTQGANSFHLDFADNSSNAALGTDTSGVSPANTWTVNNLTASVDTFGSVAFDGSTSRYVRHNQIPVSSTWALEMHFNPNNSSVIGLFDTASGSSGAFRNYSANNIQTTNGDNQSIAGAYNVGEWNHLAVVRQAAGNDRVYINGTLVGSQRNFSGLVFSQLDIGTINGGGDGKFNGLIRNVRWSNYARYTANFTAPPVATDLTSDSNTQILMMAGSLGGNSSSGSPVYSSPSGAGVDSLVDTPTNGATASDTGAGGEVVGNYCTWNPLAREANRFTFANGNLNVSGNAQNYGISGTLFVGGSGKYYFELNCNSNVTYPVLGVVSAKAVATDMQDGSIASGLEYGGPVYGFVPGSGPNIVTQTTTNTWSGVSQSTPAAGDIYGVAIDFDNGAIYFAKNGTWLSSGNPASGSSKTGAAFTSIEAGDYTPLIHDWGSADTINFDLNAGQRAFAYAAPSGYKSLNTASLPQPTIADGSKYFDTKLYTGNGSTQTISGMNMSPDLIWSKIRSSTGKHRLTDIVRGTANALRSDGTDAEFADTNVTAFNSDGFDIGANGNASGSTYVAWAWDAGSSTVSNTDGTITSQVRASAASGFSIVSWTGTVNATVGHGLNTAPKLVITKRRAATTSWRPWSSEFSDIARNYLGFTSAAPGTFGSAYWGSMTSTTIGLKGLLDNNNGDMIAYCFAPVEGYSAISSYQGNGNASGPFVYTGFKPAFILLKNISNAASWRIHDSARDSFNVSATGLAPDTSSADAVSSTNIIDFLSNGFKLRGTGGSTNSSGNTYIYLAFASNPFASNGGLAR